MSWKRYLPGMLVAGILAIGIAATAFAQGATVVVRVVKSDPTSCAAAFTSGTYSVGAWVRNGEGYDFLFAEAGTGVVDVTVGREGSDAVTTGGSVPCDVALTIDAPDDGAGNTIPATYFLAEMSTAPLTGDLAWLTSHRIGSERMHDDGEINLGLALGAIPADLPPGDYTGGIAVTTAAAP